MKLRWRELSIGFGVAAIVSIAVQSTEPVFSILSPLLVLPAILLAVWTIPVFLPDLGSATIPAAFVAGLLINYVPYPAGSLGGRVSFYAQLAYYKSELDAQCVGATTCHDPSRVTTLVTEEFESFIQGIARDDSGTLLNAMRQNGRAPTPLAGCEKGIVHLYGPNFHWNCG